VFYNLGFQEAASPIIELLIYFHDYIIILLVFIIVFVTIIIIFIYKRPFVNFKIINHNIIEIVWTVIPIVMLLFMAFPRLFILYLMDDITNSNMLVKVIGHQWYWEYEYSSINKGSFNSYLNNRFWYCLNTDNSVLLPILINVQLLVTSVDVIHSWTVPRMGVKADAVPGRLNRVQFIPRANGIYYGQCREICGINHSFMPIAVHVIDTQLFNKMIS
jgi:cytochrome c oxidase subunit 2